MGLVPSDPGSLGSHEETELWKVELHVAGYQGGFVMLCLGSPAQRKIIALTLRKKILRYIHRL